MNISFAPTALAKGWIDQTTAVFAHVVLMHLRERVRALLDAGCAGRDDERRYKRYAQWGQLGEIAEQWVNLDELGMLIELGVVASADKSK